MFTNSWAIALGIAAVCVPFLVHWLTKPRPVRLPISTIRFVREAVQQRRARHRLRDIIVLTLRTLAILLLAAAIARPLIGTKISAQEDSDADTVRIVILDVSQSMSASERGIELFERARPLAGKLLEYRSGLRANLILAAAQPQTTFDTPTTNLGALQETLADAVVQSERLQIQPALNRAADLFSRAAESGVRRELIVISDFQRTNWAAADFSVLPADTEIQLNAIAPEQTSANLAILNVSAPGRLQAREDAELAVEIGNFSAATRTVRVEVSLGEAVYTTEGDCPARSRTTLTTRIKVPDDGWRGGVARLVGVQDALAADNERHWVLRARPVPLIAMLTREREDVRPSGSYFLERAFQPDEEYSGGSRLVRLDAVSPDPEVIQQSEVIVIVRSGRLSNEVIHQIASLLRRGRGVLYVAVDGVDALNLQQLAEAAGSGLQLPVEFVPPLSGVPREDLFVTHVETELPPFSIFGDGITEAVAPLRFRGGLDTRRVAETIKEDIRATLSDQSACLIVTRSEAGTLAVLNLDLEVSDLPGSPLFVPLLSELLQRELLEGTDGVNAYDSGEPFALALPIGSEGMTAMQIIGPDASVVEMGDLYEEKGGMLWQGSSAGQPGVYQVRQHSDTIAAMAVVVPDEESDLRALSADVLQDRLAGGRNITYRASANIAGDERDTAWSWMLVLCVLCVVGEVTTLHLFRS